MSLNNTTSLKIFKISCPVKIESVTDSHDSPVIQWRNREHHFGMLESRRGFWPIFLLILVASLYIRSNQLDMPPVDFPADRQRSSHVFTERIMDGSGSIHVGRSWLELQILPWISGKTSGLCRIFNCEIWTLARTYNVIFSILTILLAALAVFMATARPATTIASRRRITLFFTAAIGLNPFHADISRLILAEPLALLFQAGALVFFFRLHQQNRYTYGPLLCMILLLMFSALAKLTSLVWLPSVLLALLCGRRLSRSTRIVALILIIAATAFVLAMININPVQIALSFKDQFRVTYIDFASWFGTTLWDKVYLSRIVLVFTMPGIFFALIGLFRSPWIFQVTAITALVCFYLLVNINVYNFCHLLIPGMALAAWGMDQMFLLAAIAWNNFTAQETRLSRHLPRGRPVETFMGILSCIALVMILYPLGPRLGHPAEPRPEIEQVVDVYRKHIPVDEQAYNDDMEGSVSLITGTGFGNISKTPESRFFYSIDRFDPKVFDLASVSWIRWASLPGEPNGILFDNDERAGRVPQNPVNPDREQLIEEPGVIWPGGGIYPANRYSLDDKTLSIDRGTSFALEITWKHLEQTRLMGLRWWHLGLDKPVPVPIRTGGFSYMTGGVLCLPQNSHIPVEYIFEVPKYFPDGKYRIDVFPIKDAWITPGDKSLRTLPFNIEIRTPGDSPFKTKGESIRRLFRYIHPLVHHIQPTIWSGHRSYKNMILQGYRLTGTREHLFTCPDSPSGEYELRLKGGGTRSANLLAPRGQWPVVYIYVPPGENAVGSMVFNSRDPETFRIMFKSEKPFEMLFIRSIAHEGTDGRLPTWMTDFVPGDYGRQHITLREAELVYRGPLNTDFQAPGQID